MSVGVYSRLGKGDNVGGGMGGVRVPMTKVGDEVAVVISLTECRVLNTKVTIFRGLK